METSICFEVRGRYALFTDPVSKIGGDKCSYPIPTYEALKGVTKSIFWKPTFLWFIDKVRVMNPIRTESKNVKPLNLNGGNTLAIYSYLCDVRYQVVAHFEWNLHREEFAEDRIAAKHCAIAEKMLRKGGRRDISLGTRECQATVEPCVFGEGEGCYDHAGELPFGVMFHGFSYPDETGVNELRTRFWMPVMRDGVIEFPRPEACSMTRFIRKMAPGKLQSSGLKEEALQHELA